MPFQATESARPYDALRPLPVSVLLDNVRSMYNVGAFFRTADAAGVRLLCLSGITARPPKREIAKTALGAELSVPWEYWPDAELRLHRLQQEEVEIAVVETSTHAVDLFDWQPRFPLYLILGMKWTASDQSSPKSPTPTCGSRCSERSTH